MRQVADSVAGTAVRYFIARNVLSVRLQWRTLEFCSGVGQQIQLRTDDRENGDLGAVAS